MASAEMLLADCPWHSGKDNIPDLEYNLPTSYGKIAFLKNYPDAATISAHIVGSLSILCVCMSVCVHSTKSAYSMSHTWI